MTFNQRLGACSLPGTALCAGKKGVSRQTRFWPCSGVNHALSLALGTPSLGEKTGPSVPSRPRSDVAFITVTHCPSLCKKPARYLPWSPGPHPAFPGGRPSAWAPGGRGNAEELPRTPPSSDRPQWQAVTATARNPAHGPCSGPTTIPRGLCGEPVIMETGRVRRLCNRRWPGFARGPCAEHPPSFQMSWSRVPTTQALALGPEETEP